MVAKITNYEMASLGDSAIMVSLGNQVDEGTHQRVMMLSHYLEQHSFDGMIEYIPAYTSVTIVYEPLQVYMGMLQRAEADPEAGSELELSPYEIVSKWLESVLQQVQHTAAAEPALVEIPVCYGGEFGPDLEFVAAQNGMSTTEVIQIHCSRDYLVYMLGFAPGFPYLGGMDKRISAPRKQTPRLVIPSGTVGIAGEQTGIYPISTPGGWQLIGRTPISLFLPDKNPPTLLKAGNRIRFYPISPIEYDQWSRI
ncbi:kinase inhibitor [Paenibacillus sp. MY03]|uniref:5-oxoprolinase subunit PxpB n=1 Tax=Paenibacillus sp. MY03 TaxID=302980 RepID=UPI000B3CC9AD|nr:5-oxoprolinase subunit PxpB [Paenibacillus sp. MY03]OUS77173.1 kinase inhibitor [Paenibacillus sp. MY03]